MFSFYFRDSGFTTSKFSFLYLIRTWCVHFFLMDRFVLRSVNLAELSHPPHSPPPSVSAALSSTPERCDIGSFKLLGWTLVITGTWNCLSHADLRCTSTCQWHRSSPHSRPTRHPAQLLSKVEECSVLLCFFFFFFQKCNLLCNVMDNTNCSSFRFVATCEWKTHVFPFF